MNAIFNLTFVNVWCIIALSKLTAFSVLCAWDFSTFNDVELENDNCTNANGVVGVCKRIENCPEALRNIGKNSFKICSFDGFTEIICCPDDVQTSVRISLQSTTERTKIQKPKIVYLPQYQEGMDCPLQNGILGTCTRPQDCHNYMESDTRCGFSGYHEVICCSLRKETTTESPFDERPSQSACRRYTELMMSYPSTRKYVATNVYVMPEEFPHMGSLVYGDDVECGSALISELYAITAAQCISEKRPDKIRFNSTYYNKMYPLDVEIEDIIVHPNFKKKSIYHDIALIKLKKNPVVLPFVVPGCLQQEVVRAGTEQTVIGWGYNIGEYEENLTKTHVLSVILEACQDKYKTTGVSSEYREGILQGQICSQIDQCTAEQKRSTVDILGSPLQLVDPVSRLSKISGIASKGHLCLNMPIIYTSVTSYLDWIESIVWPSS